MPKKSVASVVMENKTVFIIIGIALFLIELEIFAVAAMKSGQENKLQVIDKQGNLIHETDGKNLSDFNKYYFEKTFGPFEQYQVRLVTKDVPFPFRAWFVAALGIPIGIILMFAFVVKAYVALFYGDEETSAEEIPKAQKPEPKTAVERIVASISGFNIFVIGFCVFIVAILYWIIPEMIMYLGRLGESTVIRYLRMGGGILLEYKWFFLFIMLFSFALFTWIVYLRYLLARKTIDSQTEVNKMRVQLEMHRSADSPLRLEYEENNGEATPLVAWDNGGADTDDPDRSDKPPLAHGK